MSDSRCQREGLDRLRSRGFTLLELMVSVALVAILAAMAFPSYREFSVRMTVTGNVNELVGALNTARSEAVKRGRQVAVIANGGDWNSGWQIIAGKSLAGGGVAVPVAVGATQADCTGDLDLDGVTPLCPRFNGPLPDTYFILTKATGAGAVDTEIVFGGTGTLVSPATGFDFSVCRPSDRADTAQSRLVKVAQSGIITTHRDTSSSLAGTCS